MANKEPKHEVVSRKEAKQAGSKYYFTGKPCPHGHFDFRYVSTCQCLECVKIVSKIYYGVDRSKNKEKINAKKRRQNKTTRKDSIRRWNKYYSEKNKDKISAHYKLWYDNNREKLGEERRLAYARNPERFNVHARNRKSRILYSGGVHTANDIAEILKAQHGRCAYCRKKVNRSYHVDHIVALSRGGTNARANLQITCPSCNRQKHTTDPIDYARKLGKLL